ncbi:MAG: DUF4956 domain-containing protein [Bacteroidales bacterium]|nr:DUF4956 domain-containing protein [Bacteroidales bacterium]
MILNLIMSITDINYFGVNLIDTTGFLELLIRFTFNLLVTIVLVRYLYYPITKRKDYLFTYILIGITVFLLCFMLQSVKLKLGFALGLFAIFSIIRYRTNPVPIKEMTYLFLVIGISVINSLANKKVSYAELLLTNVIILTVTFFLEKVFLLRHESRKTILYENIKLIKPENRKQLIDDLEKRTGINISRIEIGRVNFLRDTARIRIFYFERDNPINLSFEDDSMDLNKDDDDE